MVNQFTSLFFSLPGRYAKALMTSSDESFHDDFDVLLDLLSHDRTFEILLDSTFLNKKPIISFIDLLSQKLNFKKTFSSFLKLLVEKNRLVLLHDIYRCYQSLWNCKLNQKTVSIKTVMDLDEKETDALILFSKDLFPQNLSFVFYKDPSLLGGFVIETDTHKVDASLLNQIKSVGNI